MINTSSWPLKLRRTQSGQSNRSSTLHVFPSFRTAINKQLLLLLLLLQTLQHITHTTMDPFSAEGELLNLHNFFHQGQYAEAVAFDAKALSAENALPARVLSLRAQLALGQYEDVLADIAGESEPELKAVGALAEFLSGEKEKGVAAAEALATSDGENSVVEVVAGTVLQAGGKSEEALALLGLHQGNCEFYNGVWNTWVRSEDTN